MPASPTIDWVNHASFVLRRGPVALLCDPWVTGTAFDDGWALCSPSAFGPEVIDAITHIWVSHEHPDHFSPASLRSIPEERRSSIEVLYQPTKDRKVLEFCGKLGFRTRELEARRWTPLGSDVSVWVAPWSSGDSILGVRTPEATFLNLNDAVAHHAPTLNLLRKHLDGVDIDVVMTQFSYANWEGNPDDVERRRRVAALKLDAMVAQTQAFEPRYVIPFASFVYFCHEENHYLNDEANRVGDAVAVLRDRTDAEPVVLYPGDTWTFGDEHDDAAAIERYDADVAAVLGAGAWVTSPTVDLPELQELARSFLAKLGELNGERTLAAMHRLGLLQGAHLWITDLDLAVRLDRDGLAPAPEHRSEAGCDLALGSEALAFCFRQLYGGSTLNVNGRFREPAGGDPSRFRRYMQISGLNNRGVTIWGAGPEVAKKATRVALDRLDRLRSH